MTQGTPTVRRRTSRFGSGCVVAIVSLFAAAHAAETSLSMTSEAGDYIGAGQVYSYGEEDGSFVATGSDGPFVSIGFQTPDQEHWWLLAFAAADGAALAPGRYLGATRYPFQGSGEPGLSVTGDGRACSQLTGAFEIKRLELGTDGTITSFWVVFEQHCEGNVAALAGDLRFNADVAVAVTAPFSRRAPRGRILTFDVTATEAEGHAVSLTAVGLPQGATFIDHGNRSGTFAWTPPASAPLGPVDVTFVGDNGAGRTDAATTTVDVRGVTRLSMTSDPGDYIGAGGSYRYGDRDGVLQAFPNNRNGVSLSFFAADRSEWWFADFAAPDAVSLQVGAYPGATRYPFEAPGEPGLSVSGTGRGCNTLTGSFDVNQLTRSPSGAIESFWATFEQHCEGGAPALRGEVKYNADVPEDPNHPPTSAPGGNRRVECASPGGSRVTLDGSGSRDADGHPLRFTWSAPGIVFDNPSLATPSALFPLGATTVTLAVSDGQDVSMETMLVSVVDTTPPEVRVAADVAVLLQPNHDLRDIVIDVEVRDTCDPAPTFVLSAVRSSERERGHLPGDLAPDIADAEIGTADTFVRLRAERNRNGPGRIYTLTYAGRDAARNTARAAAVVRVPNDAERGERPGSGSGASGQPGSRPPDRRSTRKGEGSSSPFSYRRFREKIPGWTPEKPPPSP